MQNKTDLNILNTIKSVIFYIVLPILVLIFGTLFNLIGIAMFQHKRMKKLHMGLKNIYIFLFAIDSIALSQILVIIIFTTIQVDITTISDLSCKIYKFINHILNNISAYILLYISIDRYISIKYPEKRFILKKRTNQYKFIFWLIIFQVVYNVPVVYFYERLSYIQFLNERNISGLDTQKTNLSSLIFCECLKPRVQLMSHLATFSNRIIIPSALMVFVSSMSLHTLFKSRKRTQIYKRNKLNNLKDYKFTITSIFLNVSFILFVLPISVFLFNVNYIEYFDWVLLFAYSFYFSYGINFLIILATNSIFRKAFLQIISKKAEK